MSVLLTIYVIVFVFTFTKPFLFAPVNPLALSLLSVFADVRADTVLFACLPLSDVLSAIGPDEGTLAFSFVVDEVSLIFFAVPPF